MQKIIFACVHNAGRSQMSAAFFNQFADPKLALAILLGPAGRACSSGGYPGRRLEVGIDLRHAKPQKLTLELARGAEMLITMGTVEMIAPASPVCAATTGHCQIQRIKAFIPSGRLGKISGD